MKEDQRVWLSQSKNRESLIISLESILSVINSLSEPCDTGHYLSGSGVYKIDKTSKDWLCIKEHQSLYIEVYNQLTHIADKPLYNDNTVNLSYSNLYHSAKELKDILQYKLQYDVITLEILREYFEGVITPFKIERLRSCSLSFPLLYQMLEIKRLLQEATPHVEFTMKRAGK